MRKLWPIIGTALAVILISFVATAAGYDAAHDFDGNGVLDHRDIATHVAYVHSNYGAIAAEPTATFTPIVMNTPTPTPTPTATPEPETHDTRTWHAWNGDHEHKDDPHALDDVFGTQVYEWMGGEIGSPWGTSGENVHKHEDFGWIVFQDMPQEWTDDDVIYIRNLRAQLHMDLHAGGAQTRFHSAWIELEACLRSAPNDCGIMRYGGWQDYGELRVDGNWIPLGDQDPSEYDGVEPPAVPERQYDNLQAQRGHAEDDPATTRNEGLRVSWKGRFAEAEMLGLSSDLPETPHIYSGFNHFTRDAKSALVIGDDYNIVGIESTGGDNSYKFIRFFVLRVRERFAVDGRITWSGYTYRTPSKHNAECAAPALDCVPMQLENFPIPGGQSVTVRFGNNQRTEYGR